MVNIVLQGSQNNNAVPPFPCGTCPLTGVGAAPPSPKREVYMSLKSRCFVYMKPTKNDTSLLCE